MIARRYGIAAAALLVCSTALCADDWPQWFGPQRDGVWRESGILEKFPAGGPKVLWRVPIAGGYTGPAVAEGKLVVMDRQLAEGAKVQDERAIPHRPKAGIPGNERILCLDPATGKELWKYVYDCSYTVSYPAGPRCTPLIHDGKVYTLGTEGHLHALELATGKVLWAKDFNQAYNAKPPLWGHSAHPLLDGQRLICMVGGEGSAVVALDKDTGKELWRSLTAKEQGYCPPSIIEFGGKRQLIVWHSDGVFALNPETGKEIWGHPFKTYQNMAIAMPRRLGDKLFVTGYPQTAFLFQLKADPPGVDVVWKAERKLGFTSCFGTPFEVDGYLYGTDKGNVLTCIKADTGERTWQSYGWCKDKPRRTGGDLFLTRHGERFFLFTELGDLLIVKLSPKGYEEIDRTHLLEPTGLGFGQEVVWCAPAYAQRCMFVRNDKEIICVSLAAD